MKLKNRTAPLIASVVAVAAASGVVELPFSPRALAQAQAPAEPDSEKPEPSEGQAIPEPPAPAEPPAAPTTTAPPAPPVPAPPAPRWLIPPEFAAYGDGQYAPILQVQPAHRLAMMEAGRELPETDPLVARAAVDLAKLTAKFLEDAPRIAELTIRTTAAIRKANHTASPLELMEAALSAKRPAGPNAVGPRRFDVFAAQYQKARVEQGKDHAAVVKEFQAGGAPVKPR